MFYKIMSYGIVFSLGVFAMGAFTIVATTKDPKAMIPVLTMNTVAID